jgi:hypothetical protein
MKAHLERCHHILNNLRRLSVGWDAEFEPSRVQTMRLQLRLNLVQRRQLIDLHENLNWQFQALQLNTQVVNQFMQMDRQERIGLTNERLGETNTRLDHISDTILEHTQSMYEQMKRMYEQQRIMHEQQQNMMNTLQGMPSPSFSVTSSVPPVPGTFVSSVVQPSSAVRVQENQSSESEDEDYNDARDG